MVAGQVGVVATHGLLGRAIRAWTRSPVNHAVFDVDGEWCVSAEPRGARLRRITEYPGVVWSQFVYADRDHEQAATDFALAQVEARTGYNFLDDAALALVLRYGWHAPTGALRRLSRPDRLQCAQLCDLALQAGGINAWQDGRPAGLVWPGLFARLYRVRGWWPR